MPGPLAAAAFVPGLLEIGAQLIDRLFPDKTKAAEAKLKLFELQQNGDLEELHAQVKLAQGQLEVNKVEAASASFFRGGWRPFVGWVCGAGLAYQFVVRPLLGFGLLFTEVVLPAEGLPSLELDTLLTLLFGMLGLGALRTTEKMKGMP